MRVFRDRADHPRMRVTAAEDVGHGLLDFGLGCFGISIEIGLRGHDDAVDAEAPLHRLFIDKCLPDGMGPLARTQSFQRRDLGAGNGGYRSNTRADGLSFNDDGAAAALTEAAAELRP